MQGAGEMNERYSDYGTPQQATMLNRTILGDERGGRKRAYVKTNMDIIHEETQGYSDHIPKFTQLHIDAGLTYMRWRAIARRAMGFGEGAAYGDSVYNEDDAPTPPPNETKDGEAEEKFIILDGLIHPDFRGIINACCEDADPKNPLLIIQAFRGNVLCCIYAFDHLDKKIHEARRIFEQRKETVDDTHEKA
jgi:hypothetical protein